MGIFWAIALIGVWASHLVYMFAFVEFSFTSAGMYGHMLLQGWLYTGLFITAHDAMHGTLAEDKTLNKLLGTLATFLFAAMSYKRLRKNHGLHHVAPATEKDPDFYVKSQNFFRWWAIFMWRYVTLWQLIAMAAIYNILIHLMGLAEIKVILYWAVPAILGTLQLFYFGVYWPHKEPHLPHMEPHRARTLKKNHPWAMLSCYFFGYHWEHHQDQYVPWWQLYKTKTNNLK